MIIQNNQHQFYNNTMKSGVPEKHWLAAYGKYYVFKGNLIKERI